MSAAAPRPKPTAPAIDWAAVRTRVELAAAATAGKGPQRTARDREELERRARAAAQPVETLPVAVADHAVVVFALAAQHFALPAAAVREVLAPRDITLLPGLAPHVRGLTNVRSRVVPVFDVRPLLELATTDDLETQRLVLLTWHGAEFALLADQVVGAREVAATQRQVAGLDTQFVQSVTSDGLILLEVDAVIRALALEDSPSR